MNKFTKHNQATAPEASLAQLNHAKERFGFVPNLLGYMAESPALINGYMQLDAQLNQSDLSATERQLVLMTINRFHECRYCMAGHTRMAELEGVDMKVINAIRDDLPIGDPKLAALRAFTLKLVEQRGVISQTLLSAFFNAGYSRQNALEVITAIALKVMSNYTNHLVGTENDGICMDKRWLPRNER